MILSSYNDSSYNNSRCGILQNVTMKNDGKVKVPSDVMLEAEGMYCYNVVIKTSQGITYGNL